MISTLCYISDLFKFMFYEYKAKQAYVQVCMGRASTKRKELLWINNFALIEFACLTLLLLFPFIPPNSKHSFFQLQNILFTEVHSH